MDLDFYLQQFETTANQLDKTLLKKKQLIVSTGIILDSVFLKLYKPQWTSDVNAPLNAKSRIFFSIWLNDKAINEEKLLYNIHAFKLRHLPGYTIASRAFAEKFRGKFKKAEGKWANVSTKFRPLTLMEGWKHFNETNLDKIIIHLANEFCNIDHLIDETLESFIEKPKS